MKPKRLVSTLCAALFLLALLPAFTLPVHAARCPNCGGSMSSKVYVSPTCEEQGMQVFSCTACGHSYESAMSALGHSYKTSTTATCTSPGIKTSTCTRCRDTFQEEQAALGHSYEEIRTEPTCTEAGEVVQECKRCHRRVLLEELPATGHEYEAEELAPTCTEDGMRTGICQSCGDEVTELLPALGHQYEGQELPATCTEAGEASETCTVCGDTKSETLPAKGHRFGDWSTVEKPTLFQEGLAERSCSECGTTESKTLPKKALKDSPGAIAAIAAVIAGIGTAAVLIGKSAAAASAAETASLSYMSVMMKRLVLYTKDNEANRAFLEQLKKRPYLAIKAVPYGDEEALVKLASEEKPDLLLLSAEAPAALEQLISKIQAAYEDAEFSVIDETGVNGAPLGAMKAEKRIMGYASPTDGVEKKLACLILPLYSPKRAAGEWTGNATVITDALGLPIISILLGVYTVGDDVVDAVKSRGMDTADTADLVNDVAGLFGLDVLANIAEALRIGAEQKERLADKKELKQ